MWRTGFTTFAWNTLWVGVLVYLVPPTLLFLSMSRIVVALGLQDSTWSLVVVYPTITVPVSVWLLIGFLKTIPKDIEEQARCSPSSEKVISTGVPTELVRGDVFFWQSLQAAAVLVAVPIALVFSVFLNRFIAGFTQGAVKG